MRSVDDRVGSRPSVRPIVVGWIAVGSGLAAAFAIGLIREAATDEIGPGLSPGSIIAFAALIGGPAIVGAIGTATRRRDVLVGAGLAYLPLSLLSFSGVTLILLIPAVLFLYAGLRGPAPDLTVARRRHRPAIALVVAGLLTCGLIGLIATMTTACWEQTADGVVRQVDVPAGFGDGSSIEVAIGADDVIASGCSGGMVSTAGVTITIACVAAAAGLAVRVGRPSD